MDVRALRCGASVHRTSPIEQLSERVRNADAAVRKKLALLRRRWGAEVQLEDFRARIAHLELRVEKERGDVEALRGGGLRVALMKLFGMLDRRIEREERELFEISLEYQSVLEQLGEAERVRLELTERILAVGDAEKHAEKAIGALKRFLIDNPGAAAALEPDMASRIEVPIEQFAKLASIEPQQAWTEAMAALRDANSGDRGPSSPEVSSAEAVAALRAVRASVEATVLGDELGKGAADPVSPRQEMELREASAAATHAHSKLTGLREALRWPLGASESHFARADEIAAAVVDAHSALSRFVREITDVYMLYPLSGAFAALVFAALRTVDEAPLSTEPGDGYQCPYLNGWISLLERYSYEIDQKLPEPPPTSPR